MDERKDEPTIEQKIKAVIEQYVVEINTGEWTDERKQNVTQAFIDQLIYIGVTGEHKKKLGEIYDDFFLKLDLGKNFPTFYYDIFLPRLRQIEEWQRKQMILRDADPQVTAIRKALEQYESNKSVETLRNIAPIIETHGIKLNRTISPGALDPKTLLDPRTRSKAIIVEKIRRKPPEIETSYEIGKEKITFRVGAYSLLCGPTNHGKTTFTINVLIDVAKRYPDRRHWFFSYEEADDEINIKFLNAYCDYTFSHNNKLAIAEYYRGDDSAMDTTHYSLEHFQTKEAEYWALVDSGRINIIAKEYTAEDLIAAIRIVAAEGNAGAIFIDYMQLLYMAERKGIPRVEELKFICTKLKNVAVDQGLAIILAAQFNREVQSPQDMIVQRISDASDIEKAANKIIAMWNGTKKIADQNKEYEAKTKWGVDPGKLYAKTLKARDSESDTEAVYMMNGNRGVISPKNLLSPSTQDEDTPDENETVETKSRPVQMDIPGEDPFQRAERLWKK